MFLATTQKSDDYSYMGLFLEHWPDAGSVALFVSQGPQLCLRKEWPFENENWGKWLKIWVPHGTKEDEIFLELKKHKLVHSNIYGKPTTQRHYANSHRELQVFYYIILSPCGFTILQESYRQKSAWTF
jgi:hypothetical protein